MSTTYTPAFIAALSDNFDRLPTPPIADTAQLPARTRPAPPIFPLHWRSRAPIRRACRPQFPPTSERRPRALSR